MIHFFSVICPDQKNYFSKNINYAIIVGIIPLRNQIRSNYLLWSICGRCGRAGRSWRPASTGRPCSWRWAGVRLSIARVNPTRTRISWAQCYDFKNDFDSNYKNIPRYLHMYVTLGFDKKACFSQKVSKNRDLLSTLKSRGPFLTSPLAPRGELHP
jgi:hypothetical protein